MNGEALGERLKKHVETWLQLDDVDALVPPFHTAECDYFNALPGPY